MAMIDLSSECKVEDIHKQMPKGLEERLKEFDELVKLIHAAADEEMPPIQLREVEL